MSRVLLVLGFDPRLYDGFMAKVKSTMLLYIRRMHVGLGVSRKQSILVAELLRMYWAELKQEP